MEAQIQEQGQEIHELLKLFKETTTKPLSTCVLDTAPTKAQTKSTESKTKTEDQLQQRKSPRLKERLAKGKTVVKMAQELVAKKCGILPQEKEMDSITLQQYLDVYKEPLTKESTEAILKLTEVEEKKKKYKVKTSKKKQEDNNDIHVKQVCNKKKKGEEAKTTTGRKTKKRGASARALAKALSPIY